jgi:uncharacterized membrane protein
MRTLFFILGGLVFGGIIHVVVILSLPQFASRDIWTRLAALDAVERIEVLEDIVPGEPNPMHLDPELIYGVCQLSLAEAPGLINGQLPLSFWSIAVFNRAGHVIYSTTNRSGSGAMLDMGIFNRAQTRLLAEQRFEVEEGLLIVESDTDDIMIVVRLAPSHPATRDRYRDMVSNLRCLNIR